MSTSQTPDASSARTVGLSKTGRSRIQRMKENGHFAEQVDAYRFAVALALASGTEPPEISGERVTMFNVGTLDPDGRLATAVRTLADTAGEDPYRVAERLAEWGARDLEERIDRSGGELASTLVDEIAGMASGGDA